jgi:sarcosine oxidase
MSEAYPLWRELERASGQSLFHEVGLLCFGPKDGEYVAGLGQALASQDVPHDVLRPEEAMAKMPTLRLASDEGAVFVPEAGWVAADAALHATYGLALAAGVEHVPAEAEQLEAFDHVVVCAGPWVRRFWPEAPVRVTLQATAHLVADLDGPVWIEDGPDLLYGFPSYGPGAKIGVHRPGKEIDPDDPSREPPKEMLEAIRNFAIRRLGLEAPELVQSTGCLYTVTADEGFLFHPLDAKTLVVSACSGHGFKFGPWIGQRVEALLR